MKVGKRKNIIQRGFTVIELCLVIVLVAPILFLAAGLLNLSTKSMLGTEQQTTVIRQDTNFLTKLNSTIRESATSFTIPQNSFIEEKLTAGWDYMGLMNNVMIPAAASRTGHEISSEQALVYIEYAGNTRPTSIPADANLLNTSDGFFVQHILAHSYTDINGIRHEYSLKFLPTDSTQTAAQNITYDFSVKLIDAQGNVTEEKADLDISTMLNTLNAVQIVYKGSKTNPATALAFREDFLPLYSAEQVGKTSATVTLVLDVSGSMYENMGSGTRFDALIQATRTFIEKLSTNDQINICVMPFSDAAANEYNYKSYTVPNQFIYNAAKEKEKLMSLVDDLWLSGRTNVGDGLRLAYYETLKYKNSGADTGKHFLIIITDGEMNVYSHNVNDTSTYYMGDSRIGLSQVNVGYIDAREYMKIWGRKFTSELDAQAFLVNLGWQGNKDDINAFKEVLNVEAVFDADSLTGLQDIFDQISKNIEDVLWAFEGPRL